MFGLQFLTPYSFDQDIPPKSLKNVCCAYFQEVFSSYCNLVANFNHLFSNIWSNHFSKSVSLLNSAITSEDSLYNYRRIDFLGYVKITFLYKRMSLSCLYSGLHQKIIVLTAFSKSTSTKVVTFDFTLILSSQGRIFEHVPTPPLSLDYSSGVMHIFNCVPVNTPCVNQIISLSNATHMSSFLLQHFCIFVAARFLSSLILRSFFLAIRWIIDAAIY
jgi:hypothetical protein